MLQENLMVFTGNANPALADGVALQLGIHLGKAVVSRFSDGEIVVEINENVRGKDVYVLQSTCAPTNDHLMEIMLMVDALKRSSAGRITAVLPYYGYSRQDRRPRRRADGRTGVRIRKYHPFGGHPVDVWRRDFAALGIQAMHVPVAEVVAEDIDDVGLR